MAAAPQNRTLSEAIRRAVRTGLADTHVSLPARIERVDLLRGVVDAQPLIMDLVDQADETLLAVAFPVITNVPIQVMNGGGFRVTFPVVRGDVCTLLFSDRSLDRWLAGGAGPVDPGDPRSHALSDAVVAIPSTNPSKPWLIRADAMTLGFEGGPQIVLKHGEIDLGGDGAGLTGVTLAGRLVTYLQALVIWATGHTHTSAGNINNGLPPAVPGDLASATVKVIP